MEAAIGFALLGLLIAVIAVFVVGSRHDRRRRDGSDVAMASDTGSACNAANPCDTAAACDGGSSSD